MPKPLKHSVAVAIFENNRVLSTRRPDDDDELPGIWGLPAGTLRQGESVEDVIVRIGRDKLGARLTPTRKLSEGRQERATYVLRMELWEALLDGDVKHLESRWGTLDQFQRGAEAGSLCCQLAQKIKSRIGL